MGDNHCVFNVERRIKDDYTEPCSSNFLKIDSDVCGYFGMVII